MRVDGFGFFVVLFIVWVVVPAVIGFALYWIVRLGVKHGLRSYEADKDKSTPTPA